MSEKFYTAIARCAKCNKVLNTAENVPESQRGRVIMSAPLMAVCDVKEHNSFSDLNLKVKLEWLEQDAMEGRVRR